MNAFAKVLVGIVLVLSVGFAVSQMILHANRKNYYDMYLNESNNLAAATAENTGLKDQKADLSSRLDTAQADLRQLQDEFTDEKKIRDEKIAALTEQGIKLQTDLDSEHAALLGLVRTNDEKSGIIDNMKVANQQTHDALMGALGNVEKLSAEVKQKTGTIDGLNEQVVRLEDNIRDLNEENADMGSELSRLSKEGVPIFLRGAPPIDGKVVQIDGNFVVIDRGKGDGVKVTFPFLIYRDSMPVAKVTVVEVKPDHCVAKIGPPDFPEAGSIQIGDNATTRRN